MPNYDEDAVAESVARIKPYLEAINDAIQALDSRVTALENVEVSGPPTSLTLLYNGQSVTYLLDSTSYSP